MLKILIDTNILIHLEDNKVIEDVFSSFYKLAISNDCKVLYDACSIPKDLERDKDLERRKVILSKLQKYEVLNHPATPTVEFYNSIQNNKINDKIDNHQLYQVYKGYVDLFVTQDKGIHSKARFLNLQDKVLTVEKTLSILENQFIIRIPTHPILENGSIRVLEDDFRSSFFDSLRSDYGERQFDTWLQKCVRQDRMCYSLKVEGYLQALLIYNIENVQDHQIPNIFDKVLKICTLKVFNDAFGIKLGELFLNKMFELCISQEIRYLYLTVYEKQVHLIDLLDKFGFNKNVFKNSLGIDEIRMIKCLDKSKIVEKSNDLINHPFYIDSEEVSKFAVPIKTEFYRTLFKDGGLREPTLFDKIRESIDEIHGNTILKAYVSGSRNMQLRKGDLLFFYSSKSNQAIEPIGVLESVQRVSDFKELWNIVRKKTVFSQNQLQELLNEKGELHVIIFRLITYMERKIDRSRIKKIDSFKNNIPTITRLKEQDYIELKNEGYFDERYIIN